MKKWTPQQKVTGEQASPAFLEYLSSLERQVAALEAAIAAIGAVASPTGGGTVDVEARAAIDAIRTAAQ